MDATNYCSNMNAELTALKARIYTIARELDRQPGNQEMQDELSDMYCLVDDLTMKINDLNRECPTDWGGQKQEIDQMKSKLNQKVDLWDAVHIAGGYVGG